MKRAIEFDQMTDTDVRRKAKAPVSTPATQDPRTVDVGRYADYLAGVQGHVEATNFEKHSLWNDYATQALPFHPGSTSIRYDWRDTGSGYLANIGTIDGRPIWISLLTATVNGMKLLFWHVTSPVADHDQCTAWLDANLPPDAVGTRTDPMNFSNILR